MPESQKANASLTSAVSSPAVEDLAAVAAHFGVRGEMTALSGERDENFRIQTEHGAFVLKITHPAEDRGAIAFQTRAMLHIASADPALPIPRLLPARDGRYEVEIADRHGEARIARLLSFLPGTMAAQLPRSRALRAEIGAVLARLDRALADFSDPSDTFELYWDIGRAAALRPMLAEVALPVDRDNAGRALDRFDAVVAPALPRLRRQVIHNDLTPFNILVSAEHPDRITGIIDFGDLMRAPVINDLAIACAYHVGRSGDPLAPVLEIVAAYHAVNPLERCECDLLYDLIATRLAMTVLITEWRAARNPENRAYILKNHPTAAAGLVQLGTITSDEAQRRLRRACKLEV
ncbi:MAG TPA: phosphotransferase [Rhizomicrobium sp.]|jgi:Ser/Thr protein kinase RdoA (MazF antagonist)